MLAEPVGLEQGLGQSDWGKELKKATQRYNGFLVGLVAGNGSKGWQWGPEGKEGSETQKGNGGREESTKASQRKNDERERPLRSAWPGPVERLAGERD